MCCVLGNGCWVIIFSPRADRVMLKPVFIPRSRRETIREQEEKAARAAAVKEQSVLLKEVRVRHTKQGHSISCYTVPRSFVCQAACVVL